MSRNWLFSVLCIASAVVFTQLASAGNSLRVNESATRFLVQDQTLVELEINNPVKQSLPVRVSLDLLTPTDVMCARAMRDLTLSAGVNKITLPLSFFAAAAKTYDDDEILWYRLRYNVSPTNDSTTAGSQGLISLSQIQTPDIFAVHMSTPRGTHAGGRLYIHVRAEHPLTEKPVSGVALEAQLNGDDETEERVRATGITDAQGYALIVLSVPKKADSDSAEIKIVARHGGFTRTSSGDINLNSQAQIMITTDKPLYQPGQALHMRVLIFDAANRAVANAKAILKVEDPESTTLFQQDLVTSRFGVASADWAIPENVRLGQYLIEVGMNDDAYEESSQAEAVKISRYDLPNFTVTAKSDRSYYLPQQNAEVEIHADYLFGQPVKRGHVRVVEEEEHEWNFREQKWDTTTGKSYEGEADDTGLFKVRVDLAEAHKDLNDEDYNRFKDLKYAAYVTDPTTNRTEQRRFDLRITKDPIHIYVTDGPLRQAPDFPMEFYVATSLADGTPVPCDVTIREVLDEGQTGAGASRLIKTNKYGVAKVTGFRLNRTHSESPSLSFTATNDSGSGTHTESFYFSQQPVIRVETDKAIYKPGDAIQVTVSASQPRMDLFVDVATNEEVVQSRSITLENGTATFSVPYQPKFQNELTISAYSQTQEYSYYYDFPFGARSVLFPHDRDLKLNVQLDHPQYKPGEEATVALRVLAPNGKPANSALGVVVFDRAVEERARTEDEFNGSFGFYRIFNRWRRYEDQVGGISRKDLQNLDPTKPISADTQLIAELLLSTGSVEPRFFDSDRFTSDAKEVFSSSNELNLRPVTTVLAEQYKNGVYPSDGIMLRRLLFESGIEFDQIKDPWGTSYDAAFFSEKDQRVIQLFSAGPDKTFDTSDDMPVARKEFSYFLLTGEAINRAVTAFHARTGGYIRDEQTLKNELRQEGIDFDALRDPWGSAYNLRFEIEHQNFTVRVVSAGPDKILEPENRKSDDFTLWLAQIDYLVETRFLLNRALSDFFKTSQTFPANDVELQRALDSVPAEKLRDVWGRPYYAVFKVEYHYADRAKLETVSTYGQPATTRTELTPVTQQLSSITLRSAGADRTEGTWDDFDVAHFSQLTAEKAEMSEPNAPLMKPVLFSGSRGAIKGVITDLSGGVIPDAKVTAALNSTSQEFQTKTGDDGRFILENIPVGHYTVTCDAAAFKRTIVSDVPVSSSTITTLNLKLEVAGVTETVTVTAEASLSNTVNASSITTLPKESRLRVSISKPEQLATPRLREYFPETLVWQPAIETDKQGRAQLKFKLADNITTWKMSIIGSTEDGELGAAETEFKSFQPFFVEHDPPRILTEGDRISLPIVLRNYLERSQAVDISLKPEKWFDIIGPAEKEASVAAGDATRETFEIRAVASVKDGKQRITAGSKEASDAIEKPVTVHPDGQQLTQTSSDLLTAQSKLSTNLPVNTIPGSANAELRIYPGLMAHVTESVEAILERPHGCGEQTISSTYPSLLVLRRDKQLGIHSPIDGKAQRYAELGYQRLLSYRSEDGGFSYWGRGDSDVALTAYAVRFLHDAQPFVSVDESVIKEALTWLLQQQKADGSFSSNSALVTSYVARVLATTLSESKSTADTQATKILTLSLQRALIYLSARSEQIDEPYLLAGYALATEQFGDKPAAARAVTKLRRLVITEGDTNYWALETNTPFYGWGLAGRLETTALVLQALAGFKKMQGQPTNATDDVLIRKGLLFLLRSKDSYGVWYSTQATINVLDALISFLSTPRPPGNASTTVALTIVVNGQPATTVKAPASDATSAVIRTDVSAFLHNGENQIELRQQGDVPMSSVQLVTTYYVPWAGGKANTENASLLNLTTSFDKHLARVNEEITCHVKAERVGFRGYGMLLGEIGLPPGADVDRASLETAMKKSFWAISQYDVLPDRIVVYLWPRAGGVDFDFKFRPRFALNAKTAASTVYDYYNPSANAIVPPEVFEVKE